MEHSPPPLRLDLDKIDERWFAEWVSYGFREFRHYLRRHAAFAAYLETHPPKEEEPP